MITYVPCERVLEMHVLLLHDWHWLTSGGTYSLR